MSFMEKLRILPTLILAAAFLLVVKVGDVWRDTDSVLTGVSSARAEQPTTAKPTDAKPAEAKPAEHKTAEAAPGETKPGEAKPGETKHADAKAGEANSAEGAAASHSDTPVDPSTMSKGEIELLQGLAQRRNQLDDRARDLDMREKLLTATEGRIDEKIAELKALQAKIDSLVKENDSNEDAQMASLVKVYENMKPADAARIFDQLDMPVLLSMAQRMKEAKMAAVLAQMSSPAAKALTVELATRQRLPATGG